jgi:hypothetical protein
MKCVCYTMVLFVINYIIITFAVTDFVSQESDCNLKKSPAEVRKSPSTVARRGLSTNVEATVQIRDRVIGTRLLA